MKKLVRLTSVLLAVSFLFVLCAIPADDADGDACAAGECKADEGLASGVDADERHLG